MEMYSLKDETQRNNEHKRFRQIFVFIRWQKIGG